MGLKQEIIELRHELRQLAVVPEMVADKQIGTKCKLCGHYWSIGKPERHLQNCKINPEREPKG